MVISHLQLGKPPLLWRADGHEPGSRSVGGFTSRMAGEICEGNDVGARNSLSPIIMEVENYPTWKETNIWRYTHFSLNHDCGRKGMDQQKLLQNRAFWFGEKLPRSVSPRILRDLKKTMQIIHQKLNGTLPTDPYISCNRAIRSSGFFRGSFFRGSCGSDFLEIKKKQTMNPMNLAILRSWPFWDGEVTVILFKWRSLRDLQLIWGIKKGHGGWITNPWDLCSSRPGQQKHNTGNHGPEESFNFTGAILFLHNSWLFWSEI